MAMVQQFQYGVMVQVAMTPDEVMGQAFLAGIDDASACFSVSDAPNNNPNSSHQGSTHGRHELRLLWKSTGGTAGTQAQLTIPFYPSQSEEDKHNMGALTLHRKRFNYLFLDGHVVGMNPMTTFGTGTMVIPKGIWSYDPED
jgi:prepilin-type processing-associated H-X9-DG protein